MRGDFDKDPGALADEILAFCREQFADIPDWTLDDWQREQLERNLEFMATTKRRPTKRAPRTRKPAKRNPQDTTLRNARATTTRIGYLTRRIIILESRLSKLEEVIAARVVGKP